MKRLFMEDGQIVPEAQSLSLEIEHFMRQLVEKCADFDLRDLTALVHSHVNSPAERAILARRHVANCADEDCSLTSLHRKSKPKPKISEAEARKKIQCLYYQGEATFERFEKICAEVAKQFDFENPNRVFAEARFSLF